MKLRLLITLVVVIGMIPVGTAQMAPQHSPDVADIDTNAAVQSPDEGDEYNYTRLFIESDGGSLQIKPGESDELTMTVENREDEAVTVDPHLYASPVNRNVLEESWVSIDGGETTIAAGEEAEFSVTVNVPEDAEVSHYNGLIAFTDEKITYPGRPARPVHSQSLYVNVWREPTVHVLSGRYSNLQVEAGDSVTHQIVVENTGDEAVPLSPALNAEDRNTAYYPERETADQSWFDVDAPAEIAPGETETVSVTVSAPSNADRGRYNAELNLGLKDPAREDRSDYWQRIDFNLEVWQQPDEAFETAFDVSEETENVTLTLSSRSNHYANSGGDSKSADFDVQFVSPDGDVVDANRVELTDTGNVNMGSDRRTAAQDGDYEVRAGQQRFTYRLDDPDAGTWSVRVMPENTIGFGYEIVRNESGN